MDLATQVFGRLTVLYRDNWDGHFWFCQCQCSNIVRVNSKHLKRGNIKSCGCLKKEATIPKDLTGKNFGYWTVIRLMPAPTNVKYKTPYWLCRCICGNEKIIAGNNLRRGGTRSCGCLRTELQRSQAYDLTGKIFGNWTVIQRDVNKFNNWIVQCSCVNKTIRSVAGYELKIGNSTSCGCIYTRISRWEKEVIAYLISVISINKVACNKPLGFNLRPDIVIGHKKLIIECNGVYWHSAIIGSDLDNRWRHYRKRLLFNSLGYKTVFIWEDDWYYRKEAIKLYLNNILCPETATVWDARKLKIATINQAMANIFLNKYHPQGETYGKNIWLGLFYNNELIACMGFALNSRPIIGYINTAELSRYASKGRVRGGASRLLKEFTRLYPSMNKIISFSDNDYFDGNMYQAIGFEYAGEVAPDYTTIWNKRRRHKSFTKRANLIKLDKQWRIEFDPDTMTESSCLAFNGVRRAWNSGKKRWVYNIQKS